MASRVNLVCKSLVEGTPQLNTAAKTRNRQPRAGCWRFLTTPEVRQVQMPLVITRGAGHQEFGLVQLLNTKNTTLSTSA